MAEIFPVETRGVGKPDYSREVSVGRMRPGLTLKYMQGLKIFGDTFSSVNTGTHTAAMHPTIMTDDTAHFTVNALIDLVILNVTDGSSGVITANTETTVTVEALIGGATNRWNPGDVYAIPSPFPYITFPLAAGVPTHIVDTETGLEMPYVIPVGYTLTAISASFSYNQDMIAWLYIDGLLMASLGAASGGSFVYVAEIVGWGTVFLDPAALRSHTFDIQITNQGGANMEGGGSIVCIVEAVGTKPLPDIKTVKCRFCGHEETVSHETQHWVCPGCSQLNIFFNLRRFRRTP